VCRLLIVGCVVVIVSPRQSNTAEIWKAPFDSLKIESPDDAGAVLDLPDVLGLIASHNPGLKAFELRREASRGLLRQAGLWPNPEFTVEAEDVGWDAPGLDESELSVSLSQEFELFGQRGARKDLARAQINATQLTVKLAAFDLYLEAKNRFYVLFHAQEKLAHSRRTVDLADSILANIKIRIEKGAALQSELLLAELERQRAQLQLLRVEQEALSAATSLAALWNDTPGKLEVAANSEPSFSPLLARMDLLEVRLDSSRSLIQLNREATLLRAERSLAASEAHPSITLSGGMKRLDATNSNSFLFGLSVPLPFFNRNQGTRDRLTRELHALDYDIERVRQETRAKLRSRVLRAKQLVQRHNQLDSRLLPTAEDAYTTLRDAYEAGRVPYTQLLEAERSLNELRFEHNDMLLDIHLQIMAIEKLTGVTLGME
jgi:cobalt-zinc-cadmium efflux system outer membrane protein